MTRRFLGGGLVVGLLALGGPAARAQDGPSPTTVVLAGYGTVNYAGDRLATDYRQDFTTSLSPIALVGLGSDLLFEAEFEFSLEEGGTQTVLEYAQVDYLGFQHVQLVAGKFLLPFGLFSERLHPTWINKLPTMPLLYGHAHGGVADGSLLPVLSDVGLMARVCLPAKRLGNLEFTFFATQGPREVTDQAVDDDGHTHSVMPNFRVEGANSQTAAAAPAYVIPSIAFGTAFSDNNSNKLLGGRLGLVRGTGFELHVSGFHAIYNADNFLDLAGANVAVEWRPGPFELRGEGAALWQEFEDAATATFPTLVTPAYYVQASRRIGPFEPVARWGHLLDGKVDGQAVRPEIRQWAVGLNYWLAPSVPLKFAYERNLEADDRLLVQWAYGF